MMEQFINLIVSNGLSVVIIGYFIFKDYKFNTTITGVLTEIKEVLAVLKNKNAGNG